MKMGKLKPIEQLPEDVNKGDLVRILTNKIEIPSAKVNTQQLTEYTGYLGRRNDNLLIFQNPSQFIDENSYVRFNQRTNMLNFNARVNLTATSYEILRRAKTQKGKESSDKY